MTVRTISNNSDLAACITRFNQAGEISLDLEFDKNRYRYGFNLCLVQICLGEECFLIDPLGSELDIEYLFPVLENEAITKVVFAFGEDLRLLHSLGCFPKNIFDLSIAAALLNYPPSSLSGLLEELLDLEAEKSSQNSNWFRRPLSSAQKRYAALDVLHLDKLKENLSRQAAEKNIAGWIAEENATFDILNYSNVEDNNFIKEKDKSDLTEKEWFLYTKLMEFREELAGEYNKPAYQIADKTYLCEIARDSGNLLKWEKNPSIYKAVRTGEIKTRIGELLNHCDKQAGVLNLSETAPADKIPGKEEMALLRKEQRKAGAIKNEIFMPIKKRIAEKHGKSTASYILSNRIISRLIAGEFDRLEDYKRNLIADCADELNLDVEVFLDMVE